MNSGHLGLAARAYFAPVLLFAAALGLMRVYLYLRYGQLFIAEPSAVAMAFLSGARFDLSASFTISLLFILPAALPWAPGARSITTPLLYVLLAWQVFLLGYEFADVHFYADTQRRLSYDIIYAWQSLDVVMKMGVTGFLPETVAMLAALAAYGLMFRKIVILPAGAMVATAASGQAGWAKRAGGFAVIALVTVVSVRGGLQFKPLGVSHAFMSANEAMGNLSLNGVFTTYQSLYDFYRTGGAVATTQRPSPAEEKDALSAITSPEEEVIDPNYPIYRRFNNGPGRAAGMNVVMIIMESWTGKYLKSLGGEISGGPFFDSLAAESLLMTNCFANAQRTFEGAMAVMGSFPTWNPIIIGHSGLTYQTRMRPVGSALASMGYETIFIHGGEADSMGFHKLIRRLGFHRHLSLDDFDRNGKDYDGIWGIYDEAVFARANAEFEKIQKPFFSVIMSLSSHLPFRLPSASFDKFGQYPAPMSDFLNSMGYSDYALSKFFETAKKSAYYQNTLFVITGDHTARYFSNHTMRESYLVPCLFHSPKLGLTGTMGAQASQLDLIPSIMDLMGAPAPYTAWGKSVFATGPRATALPRDSQSRVFVADGYMLLADMNKPMALYDMATGARLEPSPQTHLVEQRLHQKMKAYIGTGEWMIMENRVSPP
ncbi:MAG: sulfatase-like hydrolase/transferase [Nitrospinota bacterium]|nr:sulfatase-like hydrolase/transferase [Nitrospinota bacterium]